MLNSLLISTVFSLLFLNKATASVNEKGGEVREHVDLGKMHTIKTLEIKIPETHAASDQVNEGTDFSEIEFTGEVKKRR